MTFSLTNYRTALCSNEWKVYTDYSYLSTMENKISIYIIFFHKLLVNFTSNYKEQPQKKRWFQRYIQTYSQFNLTRPNTVC